ncbi:MAG: 3-deoxy-D-manno-octulosonate 8-phosphate phosphatase [Betaproteobacteria bacterium]|nr:3-deoxy-D-manno-octulosonate 8-phosphate phosphatase [Betaproteobacteria bacterium]
MQAAQPFSAELLHRGQAVSLAFLDVDGVFTDGGLYLDAQGESIKRFHTQDGLGIQLLRQAGTQVVVITGRDSAPLRGRLAALGVTRAFYGVHDKCAVAQDVLEELGLTWAQSAAMGDDWPDLPLLLRSALSCAPPGAHTEVLAVANHVTRAQAGHGALREFCDLLLMAKGEYVHQLRAWSQL